MRFTTTAAGANIIYESQIWISTVGTLVIIGGPVAISVRSGTGIAALGALSTSLADDPSQYDVITTSGGISASGNYATVIWDFGAPTAMGGFSMYFDGAFSLGVSLSNDGQNWQAAGAFGTIVSVNSYE